MQTSEIIRFNSSTGGLGQARKVFFRLLSSCFNSSTGGLGQMTEYPEIILFTCFNSSTGGLGRFSCVI